VERIFPVNTAERSVMTVKGLISASQVGFCQSHEHLFLSKGRSWEFNHDLLLDDPEKTAAELESYKNAGGSTIVDCQPMGAAACRKSSEQRRSA
jgi:predicted metal-dependent phosphotriesterase family hydrolase